MSREEPGQGVAQHRAQDSEALDVSVRVCVCTCVYAVFTEQLRGARPPLLPDAAFS